MSGHRTLTVLLMFLAVAAKLPVAAGQSLAQTQKPVIKDEFGDPLPEGALRRFGTERFHNPGGINSAALAPDGKLIATISSRNVLRIIDTADGRIRLTLRDLRLDQGFPEGRSMLSFAPDGKSFLMSTGNMLDTATGKELKQLPGANGAALSAALSPDGKQAALPDDGKQWVFSDRASGKVQFRLSRTNGWLAYSPDSRIIALPGANTKTICLVESATGNLIRSFESP